MMREWAAKKQRIREIEGGRRGILCCRCGQRQRRNAGGGRREKK